MECKRKCIKEVSSQEKRTRSFNVFRVSHCNSQIAATQIVTRARGLTAKRRKQSVILISQFSSSPSLRRRRRKIEKRKYTQQMVRGV